MRKPNPHNTPFEVTPEVEQEFLDSLAARDESARAALENYYAQDEWWFHGEEAMEARERFDESQGIRKP